MGLDRYLELIETYPQHFMNNHISLSIVEDKETLEDYMKKNNQMLGVIYESKYHIFIVDLMVNSNGDYSTYDRLICLENGVAMIPIYNNQFVLLKQYRHSMRSYQLAFPRGFGEKGLTSQENAIKELQEEIHAHVVDIYPLSYIIANSGLCGNPIDVFVAHIDYIGFEMGYEGIEDLICVSKEEILSMIEEGEITDAITLSAMMLYLNHTD